MNNNDKQYNARKINENQTQTRTSYDRLGKTKKNNENRLNTMNKQWQTIINQDKQRKTMKNNIEIGN